MPEEPENTPDTAASRARSLLTNPLVCHLTVLAAATVMAVAGLVYAPTLATKIPSMCMLTAAVAFGLKAASDHRRGRITRPVPPTYTVLVFLFALLIALLLALALAGILPR